ncbi:phosphoketolase [Kushneria phosphatilytica]|uniref:Phosphoketolase family protein n=1 Tax=Kushneria phosphatilytica TaxID=657387 RepID=A0A1S1NPA9_9GAMM|nr:phosphoketolase family protein [Kushneria phosphatilytica]OHV09698.1 phosphoketolase [Kushneria phosphatilytica]QEL11745.1 phosphoketolase family protein [Kushneria phosphatilytica]
MAVTETTSGGQSNALSLDDATLQHIDRWWRAANYLTVGQIYLQANPLLRESLEPEHIKPRLLGHWGTSPGLNLIYAHLNEQIRARDLNMIYLAGPGHGGPALLANVWLEGSYSEHFPQVTRDGAGMRQLFRQFSTPGGVPSHVSVPTPGSIHEGGELGYVLVHAFGAVFDNPDLIATAVVGDGEAETGPLEGSWKGIRFLNPARDGAVLPILHLNGYKIGSPTVLSRESDETLTHYFRGHGYEPRFVEGDDPMTVHRAMADTLTEVIDEIHAIQRRAREEGVREKPAWPMIVMRTPKGWTGPDRVDGVPVEGTFHAHQVPMGGVRDNDEHRAHLERWMRSYRPDELFDDQGRPREAITARAPQGKQRMGSNPHANGGMLREPLSLRDTSDYAVEVTDDNRGRELHGSTERLGQYMRDIYRDNPTTFRLFCPDEVNSNKLGAVFEVTDRCLVSEIHEQDEQVSRDGRMMEVLSEHNCNGWLEGYVLTGRHGMFASYEAFASIIDSMAMQHAKWLEHARNVAWREPVPSMNYLLTSTCWRNDHNGFSHQGPGFIDNLLTKQAEVVRIYLPPDANCLLSVAEHCFQSVDYLNTIVIDKHPQLQYLSMDEAREHCRLGCDAWHWASNCGDEEPDIVMACAGDIATQEMLAAVDLLRSYLPELKVRVVNVVDLMSLDVDHPHGISQARFVSLFTADRPILFAFHGYRGVVHQLMHHRPGADRIHVRGYMEEGTTTTPFDMTVLNRMSRIHLALDALRYVPKQLEQAADIIRDLEALLKRHERYIREHFEDMPEITQWVWSNGHVRLPARDEP